MSLTDVLKKLRENRSALYYSYFIMGCAVYGPWRCLTAALDYFEETYPEKNSTKLLTMVYASFEVITLLLLTLQPIQRWQKRFFIFGFSTSSWCLASIPLIDFLFLSEDKGAGKALKLTSIVVGIAGCANAVLEVCVSGTSLNLSPQYTQAFASGTGISSVFVSMIRVMTKAAFAGVNDGLRYSAYIYFGFCSLLCVTALISYIVIVKYHLESKASTASPDNLLEIDAITNQETSLLIPSSTKNISCISVFLKIRIEIAVLMVSMMVVGFINPGIIVDAHYAPMGDWFNLLITTAMSLFLFLGRSAPWKWTITTHQSLLFLGGMNLLLVPISVLILQLYSRAILFVGVACTAAFLTGYAFASCFCMVQQASFGVKESFIEGSMLVLSDWTATACGTVATFARTKLLK